MTIQEAQNTVDQWINTIGIRYYNELTNTAILMEEVGEVARIMARTYGYANPAKHCFNMDYIGIVGCFSGPVGPQLVVWGTTLLGAALIIGCTWYGRRRSG